VRNDSYIERFNRTVRYDRLSHYIYRDIEELQNRATQWLWTYNHEQPKMGIGGITPIQKLKLTQRKIPTAELH
jgi:putative transposase